MMRISHLSLRLPLAAIMVALCLVVPALAAEPTGDEIVIEERSHEEVTHINGKIICAPDVNVINPGFDVTPHELITGIITEKGILRPDYTQSISEAFKQ